MKKALLTVIIVLGIALSSDATLAHHGWSWTTGENMELTGVIKKVRLGTRMASALMIHRAYGLTLEGASRDRLRFHAVLSLGCWLGALA